MSRTDFYPIIDTLQANLSYTSPNKVSGGFQLALSDEFDIQFDVVFSFKDYDVGLVGLFLHVGVDLGIGVLYKKSNHKLFLFLINESLLPKKLCDWKSYFGDDWSLVEWDEVELCLSDSVVKAWCKIKSAKIWEDCDLSKEVL